MHNAGDNRTARTSSALERLRDRGVFRTSDAEAEGITQPTLSRLAAMGVVTRLAHGVFQHPDVQLDPGEVDYAVACARFGRQALIGGLTALFHYHLVPEPPAQIWVIVPPNVQTRSGLYRCIRSTHDPEAGVEDRRVYRIATQERAIVEAFAYATKVGSLNAVIAARAALTAGGVTEAGLYAMADKLGVKNALVKKWEVFAAP